MADIPRLNGIIGALEAGQHAFTAFTPTDVEAAIALTTAKYDGGMHIRERACANILEQWNSREGARQQNQP